MNEIRKNTQEEKTIVKVTCKIPFSIILRYIICFVFELGFLAYALINRLEVDSLANDMFLSLAIFVFVLSMLICVLEIISIKKTTCTLTNKRIYGIKASGCSSKSFSYRLDMIDDVEIKKYLDRNELVLKFSQGEIGLGKNVSNIAQNSDNSNRTFSISYIENSELVYEQLSQLINSIKNDKDLFVDIEMEKVGAQNIQSAAMMKIAENMSCKQSNQGEVKDDYISQLHRLKQLLDKGVITQQEFEIKKKELLG